MISNKALVHYFLDRGVEDISSAEDDVATNGERNNLPTVSPHTAVHDAMEHLYKTYLWSRWKMSPVNSVDSRRGLACGTSDI